MIRRKLFVGNYLLLAVRRESSVYRNPAFVDGIPLTHGDDRRAGADGVNGAERGDRGDPEIRGGVARRLFCANYCHGDPFSRFHRG